MSFPWNEHTWSETAEFLAIRMRPGQRVLAPDAFWWIVARIHRFVPENLEAGRSYDWVVLHVGDIEQLPRAFLERIDRAMTAVFANDAFLVWAADENVAPEGDLAPALARFRGRVESLGSTPPTSSFVRDVVLADAPTIVRHAGLSDAEVRAEMDAFFRRIGYRYPTYRDQVYRQEMDDNIVDFVARLGDAPARVLDLAAGALRFPDVQPSVTVTRIDLSEVGIGLARTADAGLSATHVTMDAHRLAFPDGAFDAVVISDAIEHVRDAEVVLAETARVLDPAGELYVTFANRRSLHCVLQERLGYPEFVSNQHHYREFAVDEMRALLERTGFEVEHTAGCMFFPYWGVPGVDPLVRRTFDEDEPFADLMRELGRRVGAEHAFTGVVVARRRAPHAG